MRKSLAALPQPKALPFVGSFLQTKASTFHSALERWADELGNTYAVNLLGMEILVLSKPESVDSVLMQRQKLFRRYEIIVDIMHELNIGGVFAAEGEAWRRQRRLVSQALSNASIESI